MVQVLLCYCVFGYALQAEQFSPFLPNSSLLASRFFLFLPTSNPKSDLRFFFTELLLLPLFKIVRHLAPLVFAGGGDRYLIPENHHFWGFREW